MKTVHDYGIYFWDLDGTMVDASPGIFETLILTLEKYGIAEPSMEELRKCIGPQIGFSLKRFGVPEAQLMEAVDYFRSYYWDNCKDKDSLYPGVVEALEKMKANGKRLFVATGKPMKYAPKVLEKHGIAHYFEDVIGPSADRTTAGKSDLIIELVERHQLDPSDCLMIGDRLYDIYGAKDAGMDGCGIRHGFSEDGELEAAGARFVYDDLSVFYKG